MSDERKPVWWKCSQCGLTVQCMDTVPKDGDDWPAGRACSRCLCGEMVSPMSDNLELLSSLAESGWAETMTMGTDETADGSPTAVASDVLRWAVAEIERLRLTDAEWEAIEWAARRLNDDPMLPRDRPTAATLRGLLDRRGGGE